MRACSFLLVCVQHEATIEDSYQHWLMVDGQECRLEILDTGGEERYADLREKQLKEGQGQGHTASRRSHSALAHWTSQQLVN